MSQGNSRLWIRNVLFGAALCASAFGQGASTFPIQPNIIFVFSDDHAQEAIGAYGGRLAGLGVTPRIDGLAKEGMLFRQSFCTNSVCAPSRAVILTGKHSHLNGMRRNGDKFDGTQWTFPKRLQERGYATALVGKWHLESEPTGFDHWRVLPGQGHYYNPDFLGPGNSRERFEGHCTDVITELAINWLEGRGSTKPFLLMCQHKAPHRNWMPAERHLELWADTEIPEPPTLFDRWEDNASPARAQEMEIDRHLDLAADLFCAPEKDASDRADKSGLENLKRMTEAQRRAFLAAFAKENSAFHAARPEGKELVRWKYQRYMKNYLRCVRGVDESVGRLLDYLERAGLAENTIVIYSSDQGFFLGDHGWYDKRWMYEQSLRMPLIVRWPNDTRPGSEAHAMVQNLDIAPTILEMVMTKPEPSLQGRSLVPLLRGKITPGWRDAIYYHYHEYPATHSVARHYGIRTERWKLIRFYLSDEWELYDLKADPDELQNLANDPGHAAVRKELEQRLEAMRAEAKDTTDVSSPPKKGG